MNHKNSSLLSQLLYRLRVPTKRNRFPPVFSAFRRSGDTKFLLRGAGSRQHFLFQHRSLSLRKLVSDAELFECAPKSQVSGPENWCENKRTILGTFVQTKYCTYIRITFWYKLTRAGIRIHSADGKGRR